MHGTPCFGSITRVSAPARDFFDLRENSKFNAGPSYLQFPRSRSYSWLAVVSHMREPHPRTAIFFFLVETFLLIRNFSSACRRYEMFASEVMGERIDLGIPSRLPVASRPNPKPISDKHLRELSIAAKKLFPLETSFSFRAWLHFLNETGCRRTESEIDWSCVDWLRRSVVVRGKTGERELPLSRKMIRTLQFLFLRRRAAPWTGCRSQKLSAGVLYWLFKKAAEKIGQPDLRPHLLRHRRLTRLDTIRTAGHGF